MADWFVFILLTLACYRVWRLIGMDDVSAPLRLKLPDVVSKPLECQWCAASWVSLAGVYLADRYVTELSGHWLLWAVAVSCAVGFLGKLDD